MGDVGLELKAQKCQIWRVAPLGDFVSAIELPDSAGLKVLGGTLREHESVQLGISTPRADGVCLVDPFQKKRQKHTKKDLKKNERTTSRTKTQQTT